MRRIMKAIKHPVYPFGLLVVALSAVLVLTILTGYWQPTHGLVARPSSVTPQQILDSSTETVSPSSHTTHTSNSPTPTKNNMVHNLSGAQSKSKNLQTNSESPAATPGSAAPTPASTSANATVSLSLNDNKRGNITLPSNSNQCNVLSKALNDGLISSLDMRYSAVYKTEAVYVIDGVGDGGAVWWAYEVNGKSPPYGCSNVPVRDGDAINWEYIKN